MAVRPCSWARRVIGVPPGMAEPRIVDITGVSGGLVASAAHLSKCGWRVVGAMRTQEVGLERIREATSPVADDPRLIGVQKDLTSYQEVLLQLFSEGWVRWSNTVCEKLAQPGPMTPSRVAETLADGLTDDPLFCDLFANVRLTLEHEVEVKSVVAIKRSNTAAVVALADAIEQALPALGRPGALDIVFAAYSLAATLSQCANPPERLIDAYNGEPEVLPPGWNFDFASVLTRLLTATCIGIISESQLAQESGDA